MRTIDWVAHARHRTQVIADTGQWAGLLDEDMVPLWGLPQLTGLDWSVTRGAIDSVEQAMRVRTPSGRLHPVVAELVAENLGRVDQMGKLIPVTGPARLVRFERAGRRPRSMRVTHVMAEGDAQSPHTLTIYGVTMIGYLDLLPCPSNPATWRPGFTRFERDWVGPEGVTETFGKPRDLGDVKMITVADGASVDGMSADVIYRLVDESLGAVHRKAGITADPFYVAVREADRVEQRPLIWRPTDQTIWKEIAEPSHNSGVSVRADLWWPGDPQPVGQALNLPTIVFTIRQEA